MNMTSRGAPMKKSLAITTVSLLAFVASAGTAKADYPPLQELVRSTLVRTISYDRTPRTPVPAARRIVVPVPVGTQRMVTAYVNEPFTIVIPNVEDGRRYTVRIVKAGRVLEIPTVGPLNNGNLRFSTMAMSTAGDYTVRVSTANGLVRTLKIRIAA
jgi:hypothetical protein